MHAIQVVHGLARGPSLPFPAHQKREVAWNSGYGFDCGATGLQVKLARPLPPCGSVLGLMPVVEAEERLDKGLTIGNCRYSS